jgi:glycosyltransferase involved in cell wall biosynthesis
MTPTVSICVPTYNGARYLAPCLESALTQTHGDFDVVVVDDASTDETVAVAERFAARDGRVRVTKNPRNLGLVGNWGRCVELARGAWIKFLFQDDYLAPTCLATMLARAGPDTPFVVTARRLDFSAGASADIRDWYETHEAKHLMARRAEWPVIVTAERFADCLIDYPTINFIGEPTATLIHRSLFERFGPFIADMRVLVDWEYFARIGVNRGLAFIKEPLATFRVHADSTTQQEGRRSRFTNEVDGLIMLDRLAYHPDFAPARAVAKRRRPPVDLAYVLARAVRKAQGQAKIGGDFDDLARSNFEALQRRLPHLSITPPGYARQRLREIGGVGWARIKGFVDRGLRRGQPRRPR